MSSLSTNQAGQLEILEAWRGPLAEAGLDRLDVLLGAPAGWAGRIRESACVSNHTRGQTYRVTLKGGGVLFVKRDSFTHFKQIAGDLLAFRRPQPLSGRERLAMAAMAALGVKTAAVIAHGQRRRWGLPCRGVLVTDPLPGVPLDEILQSGPSPARRREAMAAAGELAGTIYAAGYSMPDFVPKHVFLAEQGPAGILDVERVKRCRWGLARRMARQVDRFCDEARRAGADEDDILALRQALRDAMDRR
jgi:hypothetical protein